MPALTPALQLAAATPAPPTRFDLECSGTESVRPDSRSDSGPPLSFSDHLRFDL